MYINLKIFLFRRLDCIYSLFVPNYTIFRVKNNLNKCHKNVLIPCLKNNNEHIINNMCKKKSA